MRYAILLLGLLAIVGCSQTDTVPVDATMKAEWTATGDDGMIGQATFYEGRYSEDIDSLTTHWPYVRSFPVPALPAPSGQLDSTIMTLPLETGVWHYFAIKIGDENGFISRISNVDSVMINDTIPPLEINDFSITVM